MDMSVLNADLINCCRVCRSPNQDGDYQCLFGTASEHDDGNINLSESGVLYEKLLDISLNERNYYYPKFLCNSCHLQMKLFMKLKDKALKTLQYYQSFDNDMVSNTTDSIIKQTLNYDYQNNEQGTSSNEPPNCDSLLEVYQLTGYEVYKENESTEYGENVVEELHKTTADDTEYENTNYSYAAADVENKLTANNSYNDVHLDQNRLYTERQITDTIAANVETKIEEDVKMETHSTEHKFLPEIETEEKVVQTPNSEEHYSNIKLEPILDKNDYVTEIYELIDDECDIEETYLENQEIVEDADYNSLSEVNTETSSIYNDIEYLLEEEIDDLEAEVNIEEIKNVVKKRRLNKECKRSRTYKCLACQLEFKYLQTYKLHRIESHNESFSCCNVCSKEFKTPAALHKHIKSQHNDEPAFQCKICHKTFNQKVHFQYHMNHHNNIRNYKCDVCAKAFIAKADLKTHLRLHTGERPYVCNVCGKDYLMMEHLKAHFLTHTEQTFPCEVCNKQFATHKTLRLHVRTIHEDEPRFKCTFCLKPFRRKHHLEYHLKKHEKNVTNLELNGEIISETDNLEDIVVEEAIDDSGLFFLP